MYSAIKYIYVLFKVLINFLLENHWFCLFSLFKLNIPLNLPQLPPNTGSPCGIYEDDPVPVRIHDCSLDLTVIADHRGIVCICHHYLYQV